MKLIGLVGRKGAGKDTAAEALVSQGYRVAKFAGGLKAMLGAYFKYIGVMEDSAKVLIEDPRVKELPSDYLAGRSPRYAMQTLGTEWGRDLIGSNLWVQSCLWNCESFDQASVITDVRFPNEVQAVKDAGGIVIRISRYANGVTDNHASENFINSLAVDHEISNNGTITELHAKLMAVVQTQNALKGQNGN